MIHTVMPCSDDSADDDDAHREAMRYGGNVRAFALPASPAPSCLLLLLVTERLLVMTAVVVSAARDSGVPASSVTSIRVRSTTVSADGDPCARCARPCSWMISCSAASSRCCCCCIAGGGDVPRSAAAASTCSSATICSAAGMRIRRIVVAAAAASAIDPPAWTICSTRRLS